MVNKNTPPNEIVDDPGLTQDSYALLRQAANYGKMKDGTAPPPPQVAANNAKIADNKAEMQNLKYSIHGIPEGIDHAAEEKRLADLIQKQTASATDIDNYITLSVARQNAALASEGLSADAKSTAPVAHPPEAAVSESASGAGARKPGRSGQRSYQSGGSSAPPVSSARRASAMGPRGVEVSSGGESSTPVQKAPPSSAVQRAGDANGVKSNSGKAMDSKPAAKASVSGITTGPTRPRARQTFHPLPNQNVAEALGTPKAERVKEYERTNNPPVPLSEMGQAVAQVPGDFVHGVQYLGGGAARAVKGAYDTVTDPYGFSRDAEASRNLAAAKAKNKPRSGSSTQSASASTRPPTRSVSETSSAPPARSTSNAPSKVAALKPGDKFYDMRGETNPDVPSSGPAYQYAVADMLPSMLGAGMAFEAARAGLPTSKIAERVESEMVPGAMNMGRRVAAKMSGRTPLAEPPAAAAAETAKAVASRQASPPVVNNNISKATKPPGLQMLDNMDQNIPTSGFSKAQSNVRPGHTPQRSGAAQSARMTADMADQQAAQAAQARAARKPQPMGPTKLAHKASEYLEARDSGLLHQPKINVDMRPKGATQGPQFNAMRDQSAPPRPKPQLPEGYSVNTQTPAAVKRNSQTRAQRAAGANKAAAAERETEKAVASKKAPAKKATDTKATKKPKK